jgi:prepilin-type N-terminal cleavage/methylation domain-containing protein
MSRIVRQQISDLRIAICNLQSSRPSTVYRLPSTTPVPCSLGYPLGAVPSRRRRAAFTLVELLMVITIIGMLVALVSVAAVRALGTANNTQITMEISLIDSAIQTYKNDTGGAYPPDCTLMGTSGATLSVQASDVNNRRNRIMAHLRKAFPRLIIPLGYCDSSGNATQGTLQNMSQQAYVQSANGFVLNGAQASFINSPPNTPNGISKWGDFDNMDPAEALVFWLGGFAIPSQDQSGKWSFKLIGFSANKVGNANSTSASQFGPFNLDVASRSQGPFGFVISRLGDADGDGWPEYYPPVGSVPQPPGGSAAAGNPMPPYVYFDSTNYSSVATPTGNPPIYPLSAVYPSPLASTTVGGNVTTPGAQPVLGVLLQWGVAMPYAQTVPAAGTITWVNPDKYQIIAAGLDQFYWYDPAGQYTSNWLRVYPLGTYYSQGDLDNLTNFTTSTLQNAQP